MNKVTQINHDYYIRIYRSKLHIENGIRYSSCNKCKLNDRCKSNIITNLHILNVPFYLTSELPSPKEKICYFCLDCINIINGYTSMNSDIYLCIGNSTYKVNTINIIE